MIGAIVPLFWVTSCIPSKVADASQDNYKATDGRDDGVVEATQEQKGNEEWEVFQAVLVSTLHTVELLGVGV